MLHYLFKSIAFCLLITLVGCCVADECDYGSGYVTFRLMRDGKNALYGPDAFLSKTDLKNIRLNQIPPQEDYIQFNDSLQTIALFVFIDLPAILEIENVTSDTISITSEFISKHRCCDAYQVNSVLRNGIVICEGSCTEVIDLEI